MSRIHWTLKIRAEDQSDVKRTNAFNGFESGNDAILAHMSRENNRGVPC